MVSVPSPETSFSVRMLVELSRELNLGMVRSCVRKDGTNSSLLSARVLLPGGGDSYSGLVNGCGTNYHNNFRLQVVTNRGGMNRGIAGMAIRGRFEFAGAPRSLEGLPRIQSARERSRTVLLLALRRQPKVIVDAGRFRHPRGIPVNIPVDLLCS
jgi:hypothetical protein